MPCSTERIAVEFIGQGIGRSAESNTGSGWVSRTSHERSTPRHFEWSSAVICLPCRPFPSISATTVFVLGGGRFEGERSNVL